MIVNTFFFFFLAFFHISIQSKGQEIQILDFKMIALSECTLEMIVLSRKTRMLRCKCVVRLLAKFFIKFKTEYDFFSNDLLGDSVFIIF